MFRRAILAVLFAFSSVQALADDVLRTFYVGPWEIVASGDARTGIPFSCISKAQYGSGVWLTFGIRNDYKWVIGIGDPRWKLKVGDKIPIQFTIDRGATHEATGQVLGVGSITFIAPGGDALFNEFRRGRLLEVLTRDQFLQFNLDATGRMLTALGECLTPHTPEAAPSRPAPGPAPVAKAPKLVPDSAKASQPTVPSAELRVEAMGIASDALQDAGIQGFKFVRGKDVPEELREHHAVWTMPGGAGTLRIVDRGEGSIEKVGADLIGIGAAGCKGSFASGVNPGGPLSSTVSTACDKDGQRTDTTLVILKRKQGGHYLFMLLKSTDEKSAAGQSLSEAGESIRKAALEAVR